MTMAPWLRRLAVGTHITSSVGWIGAVVAFLALAITGLTRVDTQRISGLYFAMELTACYVIVPFSLASLLSGIVLSLGTRWGLFRHYWVLFKLLITVVASAFLLLHLQPIRDMAEITAKTPIFDTNLRPLRTKFVIEAGAALVALLTALTLSVDKPAGLTPYGQRKRRQQ
jgi:hypothetical protein